MLPPMRPVHRRPAAVVSAVLFALGLTLPSLVAAAGPPFPDPVDGRAVYDTAELFDAATRDQAELIIDAIEAQTKAEVVVYTQSVGRDDLTTEEAEAHARALMDQWGIGRVGIDDGLVILFDLDTTGIHGEVQLFAGPGFSSRHLSDDERQAIYENTMLPLLAEQQFDQALLAALSEIVNGTFDGAPPEPSGGSAITPGPPFPDPEIDRAVYDNAGILSPDTIVRAESTIDEIEARTAAEVVVYTQSVDYGVSEDETEARAIALIDQWGIGRRGFDDGMVVFFDIDPSGEHGQVQLYAAPGFRATYLTNEQRQRIFEEDMVPFLQDADFDGALDIAMRRIDEAATPEHASLLQLGRQIDAVLGLLGRTDRLPGAVRLGVPLLAPLWQGPGLPGRSLDPHAGAAAGPHSGIGRVRDGRPFVAPGLDDGHARPRVARPDLVPRGQGPPRAVEQGRRRDGPGRRRCCGGGAASAQRPPADRTCRAVRPDRVAVDREVRRLHRAR